MKNIFLAAAFLAAALYTAPLVRYQGIATNSQGIVVADSVWNFSFALFTDSTSLTPLWQETEKRLATKNGIFTTELGFKTPLTDINFLDSLWLQVSLEGSVLPRLKLFLAPAAHQARFAQAADSAAISLFSDSSAVAWKSYAADSALHAQWADSALSAQQASSADSAHFSLRSDSSSHAQRATNSDSAGVAFTAYQLHPDAIETQGIIASPQPNGVLRLQLPQGLDSSAAVSFASTQLQQSLKVAGTTQLSTLSSDSTVIRGHLGIDNADLTIFNDAASGGTGIGRLLFSEAAQAGGANPQAALYYDGDTHENGANRMGLRFFADSTIEPFTILRSPRIMMHSPVDIINNDLTIYNDASTGGSGVSRLLFSEHSYSETEPSLAAALVYDGDNVSEDQNYCAVRFFLGQGKTNEPFKVTRGGLTSLVQTPLGTDWLSSIPAMLSLQAKDASLDIVSTNEQAWGSAIGLKQVDQTTHDFENAWFMARHTNEAGTGDGALRFMYDTIAHYGNISIEPATVLKLATNGDVTAKGSLFAANHPSDSDVRYKRDISTITGALSTVTAMRGVRYKWDRASNPQKHFSDGEQIGLIAQEVQRLVPEVVFEDENGYKSVEYAKITALLIEALKEQKRLHDQSQSQLQQRIEQLEQTVADLESSMLQLTR